MIIPFNKPHLTGKETEYIKEVFTSGKISGDGIFTEKCQNFFKVKYGFKNVLLTTSCTDALEMAAILLNIKEGDEIIAPSYTFVSTVNPFVLRGAKIKFCDSEIDHPNIDANKIEHLISSKTKAIIAVHYAGHACDMDKIMEVANKHGIKVIEDAAQAIDSYYINKSGKKIPLGSFGCLAAFSFHETKNIISGEGGLLVVNDENLIERAEIIRDKGTNRAKFLKGEVDKYEWVDIGSSFLPSDIIAAILFAQLEEIDFIQKKRIEIWELYYQKLKELEHTNIIKLPKIKPYATNNAQMFYLIFNSSDKRTNTLNYLKSKNISAAFHYLSLHQSPFYKQYNEEISLPNSELFSKQLLRLPFYISITNKEQCTVVEQIANSLNSI